MKALLLAWPLALAATARPPDVSSTQINAAIDRGVAYLVERQGFEGAWDYGQEPRLGCTALILYTLLKSGVDPRHQAIQRAVAHLEGQRATQTYDAALLVLALAAHDPAAHAARIQELVDVLLSWQHGDWGYPSDVGDLSNTQVAALGLWAGAKHGADVPARAWDDLVKATLLYRDGDGFGYRPGGEATGSMTAAGVGVLAICREFVGGAKKRRTASRLDEGIDAGLAWLARHFSVTENPGRGGAHHLYWLYGLERVGALVPTERIGAHDWYREGAGVLVRAQGRDGAWGGYPETCFALLFLRRATHPVTGGGQGQERRYAQAAGEAPVRLAASGDNPLAMWITSFSEVATEKFRWPGEKGLRIERVIWRVDGVESTRIEGDPDAPSDGDRFAHRVEFELPGAHAVEAEVHLLAPPERTAQGRDFPPSLKILRSEPLEVRVDQACPAWRLENARDHARNLLRGAELEVRASSAVQEARLAVDGRQDTAWLAAADDDRPTLTVRLGEPVDADTVVVGHARRGPGGAVPWARALEVEVRINGGDPERLRMHSDVDRKARLDLGERRRVRTIELAIPWRVPGAGGAKEVGLAEVELQLSSRSR